MLNNPLNYKDPSGNIPVAVAAAIVVGFLALIFATHAAIKAVQVGNYTIPIKSSWTNSWVSGQKFDNLDVASQKLSGNQKRSFMNYANAIKRGGEAAKNALVGVVNTLKKYITSKCAKVFEEAVKKAYKKLGIKTASKKKNPKKENKSPTSQSQMQRQVEKGQAPKEVDRVDKPHVKGQQPHVHFKDGTSLNQDGSVHDAHKGIPNVSNQVKKWLIQNGWKVNE